MSSRLLFALAICASLASPLVAKTSDSSLLVVDELQAFNIESRQEVRLLGRYRAQVGSRLELEGSDASFQLSDGARFPALLRAKADRGLIELTAVRGERRGEYRVLDVVAPPNFPEAFPAFLASARKRSPRAQEAFFQWAFREAALPGATILDPLTEGWLAWGEQERKAGVDRGIRWLQIAESTLSAHSSWIAAAQSLIDAFPGNPTVTDALRDLELIETTHG